MSGRAVAAGAAPVKTKTGDKTAPRTFARKAPTTRAVPSEKKTGIRRHGRACPGHPREEPAKRSVSNAKKSLCQCASLCATSRKAHNTSFTRWRAWSARRLRACQRRPFGPPPQFKLCFWLRMGTMLESAMRQRRTFKIFPGENHRNFKRTRTLYTPTKQPEYKRAHKPLVGSSRAGLSKPINLSERN
jgi:hypothetical protein